MGNLRSQNEPKSLSLSTVEGHSACPNHEQDDEPFEEDYIRTESYFASSSRPSIIDSTTQHPRTSVQKMPGQDAVTHPRLANNTLMFSGHDGDSSVGSGDISLPLSDSIIPDTFDNSGELVVSDDIQDGTKLTREVVSGSPTINILSDALSRISLTESNILKTGTDTGGFEPVNTDAPAIPFAIASEVPSVNTASGTQPVTTQANRNLVGFKIERPSSSNAHSMTRSLSGKASKTGWLNAVNHSDAPSASVAGSRAPSRAHSRSRRRRKRQSGKAATSDVEEGRSTEGSGNGRSSSGQTLPISGIEAARAPTTSLILTHGLSSSRWAPHSERPDSTVSNVASDSSHDAKMAKGNAGYGTDGRRLSMPWVEEAAATLDWPMPPVDIPTASSRFLNYSCGHECENRSLSVPSTQPVDPPDQRPPVEFATVVSPLTAVPSQINGLRDHRKPHTGNAATRSDVSLSTTDSRILHQATGRFDGRVGNVAHPPQNPQIAYTNHRDLQGSISPALPNFQGESHVVELPVNSQLSSHSQGHEPVTLVSRQTPQSVQYPLDPPTQYWRRVHEACGGSSLCSQVGSVRQRESRLGGDSFYERSVPELLEFMNSRLMQPTFQHFTGPHLSEPLPVNVSFRNHVLPQSSQPNPPPTHVASLVPPQYTQSLAEPSFTQSPLPQHLLPQRHPQMHVKQIRPVASMPTLNHQYQAQQCQHPILLKHTAHDAHHGGPCPLQNDVRGAMGTQYGIDLRLPIYPISEASFHSNPPPPQVMNVSQGTASHSSSASIGYPPLPEEDFNSKVYDFSARARQHSVIVEFPKEEPVNAQKLELQRQRPLPVDMKDSEVEKGLPSVGEGEEVQKEVPADEQSLNSQHQAIHLANSHPPAMKEVLKPVKVNDEVPELSPGEQQSASQNKLFQTSPFDRPVVRTKPEEILSWRTTRSESVALGLNRKTSMPALKYVPPPMATSKGILQIPVNVKGNKSSGLAAASGGFENGEIAITVSQNRGQSDTPLVDGQSRRNLPSPVLAAPSKGTALPFSDPDGKVLCKIKGEAGKARVNSETAISRHSRTPTTKSEAGKSGGSKASSPSTTSKTPLNSSSVKLSLSKMKNPSRKKS
ncbi:hypothetical protein L218DRAFT_987630 [Marasmius fiardii PR-910]|nr:hypothetical protein L218DRAFT_987630 [Marasmius fiardii PR-910]